MFKPSVLNIFLFWLVKYILFYIFHMFKNETNVLANFGSLKSGVDLFYFLWIFLFMPVVSMVLFSIPVYFSLKSKDYLFAQLFTLLIVIIAEYFVYSYLASPTNSWNGVYNGLIGIFVFLLFFHKNLIIFSRR